MRELPDSASVDHLRRQAKELLAVLRRSEPQATLTDAQSSLARQHGFPTWAALKDEVERLAAVPRVVADPAVAARLAAAFSLGGVSGPMVRVEHEWAGDVWDLTTSTGRFLATRLEPYLTAEIIEVQHDLVAAAMDAGVLVLPPVRSADGPLVVDLEGEHWRMHRRVPLGAPCPLPAPTVLAREAGRILARLHALALPAPGKVVPWLTHRQPEAHWSAVVDQARVAGRPWADALAAAVPGFLALDAVADDRDPDERAVFSKAWHAPTGVRVVGDGALLLIGWEHAGPVPEDWDLGGSLMAWSETAEGTYDPIAARAFLDGYEELAGRQVITVAMFTAGVSAALNWTISRANYALCDDDPVARERGERNIASLVQHPLDPAALDRLIAALT